MQNTIDEYLEKKVNEIIDKKKDEIQDKYDSMIPEVTKVQVEDEAFGKINNPAVLQFVQGVIKGMSTPQPMMPQVQPPMPQYQYSMPQVQPPMPQYYPIHIQPQRQPPLTHDPQSNAIKQKNVSKYINPRI